MKIYTDFELSGSDLVFGLCDAGKLDYEKLKEFILQIDESVADMEFSFDLIESLVKLISPESINGFLEHLKVKILETKTCTPEGWKLVPIEPTEDMIVDGFESEPDEFFSSSEEWEEYQNMSGCGQAAHKAKLCWYAMLKASPEFRTEPIELPNPFAWSHDGSKWYSEEQMKEIIRQLGHEVKE